MLFRTHHINDAFFEPCVEIVTSSSPLFVSGPCGPVWTSTHQCTSWRKPVLGWFSCRMDTTQLGPHSGLSGIWKIIVSCSKDLLQHKREKNNKRKKKGKGQGERKKLASQKQGRRKIPKRKKEKKKHSWSYIYIYIILFFLVLFCNGVRWCVF